MIQPLGNYIAVRPDPLPEAIGSIILPDAHRDRALHNGDGVLSKGTVVAVGKGDLILRGPNAGQYVPCEVQVGDRVIYPRHALVPLVDDGVHVVAEQHIFGVIE